MKEKGRRRGWGGAGGFCCREVFKKGGVERV